MLQSIVLETWTTTTCDMEKCNGTLIQAGIPSQETDYTDTEDIAALWQSIQWTMNFYPFITFYLMYCPCCETCCHNSVVVAISNFKLVNLFFARMQYEPIPEMKAVAEIYFTLLYCHPKASVFVSWSYHFIQCILCVFWDFVVSLAFFQCSVILPVFLLLARLIFPPYLSCICLISPPLLPEFLPVLHLHCISFTNLPFFMILLLPFPWSCCWVSVNLRLRFPWSCRVSLLQLSPINVILGYFFCLLSCAFASTFTALILTIWWVRNETQINSLQGGTSRLREGTAFRKLTYDASGNVLLFWEMKLCLCLVCYTCKSSLANYVDNFGVTTCLTSQ